MSLFPKKVEYPFNIAHFIVTLTLDEDQGLSSSNKNTIKYVHMHHISSIWNVYTSLRNRLKFIWEKIFCFK